MPGPAPLAWLRRKLRTLSRLSWAEQILLPPAWLLLGLGRALILFVPFRKLAPRLGHRSEPLAWVPVISEAELADVLRIRRVVHIAAKYTPWTSNCFPQAIAARCLLAWRGVPYVLFLGMARREHGEWGAHAWVYSGPIAVTGGASFSSFGIVGVYSSIKVDGC